MDVFEEYFGECNETSLKENYVIVYEVRIPFLSLSLSLSRIDSLAFQLLDEMLDSGLPLATETNILKELIKPPTILRKVANLVTGDSTK